MTETKEDLRDYYVVEYTRKHKSGEETQKKTMVVLEFNKAESLTAVLDRFTEEGRVDLLVSDPYPLDMSKVLTKIKLNKKYIQNWYYVTAVLGNRDYWIKLPKRKKGEVGKFYILKELPTQEEFNALYTKHYMTGAQGLVDDANCAIEDLKTQIEEWKDNIEESFSGTEKYSQLEECFDQLDRYEEIEWPDEIEDFDVLYIPPVPKIFRGRITSSRASELGEACDKLQTVIDALENRKDEYVGKLRELAEELEEKKEAIEDKKTEMDEKRMEAQSLRDKWEQYELDVDDFKQEKVDAAENGEEFDESAEPDEPEQPLSDAEAMDDKADDIENAKDELEMNLNDWCNQHDIEDDMDPDDLENAIDEFVQEIGNQKDEVECAEFPGMFG